MTLRSIQWIDDAGLLVGLTRIGEFAAPVTLSALALSSGSFTLGTAVSGAIAGGAAGSAIIAAGLPAGLTINAAPGWAYDGHGSVGSFTFVLTEALSGSPNSPNSTSITVIIAAPLAGALDLSQPANSGLIAALRSF